MSYRIMKIKTSVVAHPVIPALGRLRQEDLKFKASLSYIVSLWLV
jgi:hypothetical protein